MTDFLDWGVALGSIWLAIGLHLDGWARHHEHLESFFTPWHAVLYSGYFITAAVVGLAFLQGLRQARAEHRALSWQTALPSAYRTSLLGALIFFFGGLADLTWHTLFGIELSIDALLSPPHLVLGLGSALLVTGPLRAALYRPGGRKTLDLPALLSAAALVGLLAFFTMYANPWIEQTEQSSTGLFAFHLATANEAMVVAAVLIQSAILISVVLLLVRGFRLPFGALTLLFTIITALAVGIHMNWRMIPLGVLGGLAADLLVRALRPGETDWGTRLFAFLVPAVLYALFFGALKATGQLDWLLQMWTGTILLAGITGWLLSYAFFPPVPQES